MDQPNEVVTMKCNVEDTSSTRRPTTCNWTIFGTPDDGGIAIRTPHSYIYNMALPDALALVAHLSSWVRYRRDQFKPLGFKLISLVDGSEKNIDTSTRCEILGDSYIFRDITGTQIGEALSAGEWILAPILPATP